MDDRTKEILHIHGNLVRRRQMFEPRWQESTERIHPDYASFTNMNETPGQKKTQKMFDATAALALPRYAAAIEAMVSPRTQRWHGLRFRDKKLNDRASVKTFCDDLTDALFSMRYAPNANFSEQSHQCYLASGCPGTGALFIDDMMGEGARYISVHLANLYIAENYAGIVDYTHRKFKYTARQALQRFRENTPEKIVKAAQSDNDAFKEFEFIHCVKPNEEYNPRNRQKAFKFSSYYLNIEEEKTVRGERNDEGYYTFPYAIARPMCIPGEEYGRGPDSLVLPDIKQLNEMD